MFGMKAKMCVHLFVIGSQINLRCISSTSCQRTQYFPDVTYTVLSCHKVTYSPTLSMTSARTKGVPTDKDHSVALSCTNWGMVASQTWCYSVIHQWCHLSLHGQSALWRSQDMYKEPNDGSNPCSFQHQLGYLQCQRVICDLWIQWLEYSHLCYVCQ